MSRLTDQKYLKTEQYGSAANLEARIALHRDYGTNRYDWQLWVYDQLELEPGLQILEMGCGPASLWRSNLNPPHSRRLPEGVRVTLGDLSIGMARQARTNLIDHPAFAYLTADVQQLPFPEAQFDRLIANHMLYHVPDILSAVREFKRLLKPGRPLFAATNGDAHMAELYQLIHDFDPSYERPDRVIHRFSLETAPSQLEQVFSQVEVRPFDSNLKVTNPAALVAYVGSMWDIWDRTEDEKAERIQAFERFVQARFEAEGYIWITKSAGLIIAHD